MNKRKAIISGVVTVLLILIGAFIFQSWSGMKQSTVKDGPVKAKIAYVKSEYFTPEDRKSKITLDGRLVAYEKIEISAEATGRLVSTGSNWKKGSYFRKGDLLFSIDQKDQLLSLFAQRSGLLNAITQIMPNLKFDYPDAFEKWKKYLDDFNIEQTTAELPQIGSPEEKYFIAGKNLYNLYYSIKSAEDRLKDFKVYAPFSGVFLSVNAYPGALATPGAPLGRIMNTGRYEIESPIAMSDFDFVKRGQTVNLYSEDLDKSFSGKISRISNQIDQMTQSVPVFISVSGRGLKDGMYLKGTLNGAEITDVFALPKAAIINQNTVYVIQDSIIQEREVDVVQRSENTVYVKGINSQDEIITTGVNGLSRGQKAVGDQSMEQKS